MGIPVSNGKSHIGAAQIRTLEQFHRLGHAQVRQVADETRSGFPAEDGTEMV